MSTSTPTAVTPQFAQLQVTIIRCDIQQHAGLFKPSPYVELSVDGQQPPRKTEVIYKALTPTWNEHFTVLVTPYSVLEFRLCNHNNIRSDSVLGRASIDLHSLLKTNNGKLDGLEQPAIG